MIFSVTVKVAAFGELVFLESAGLCFERALDSCHAELAIARPDAWTIDERRIAIDLETSVDLEGADELRRFLDMLALDAVEGEVVLQREGQSRWLRVAGVPSGVRESEPAPGQRAAGKSTR